MMARTRTLHAAALCALLLVLGVSSASAQVYYMYPGAPPVPDTDPAIGATVGFADNLFRILGFGRFNMAPKFDIGFEIAGDALNSNWRFGLGTDVKYAIIPTARTLPFDLSAQLGFGFQTGAGFTNFDVPLGGVISYPIQMNSGRILQPYGGLYLIVRHFAYDALPDDTDLDVELRAGASLELIEAGDLFLTIHIGEDVAFFAGINANL